jgi:hypothetical protein
MARKKISLTVLPYQQLYVNYSDFDKFYNIG